MMAMRGKLHVPAPGASGETVPAPGHTRGRPPASHAIRRAVSTVLYRAGVLHLVAWWKRHVLRERALILSFHCVSDPGNPDGRYFRRGMNIDADQLEEILRLLGGKYRLATLAEAVEETRRPNAAGKSALAVTFDDGYRRVHTHGLAALRRAGAPATVFLPTDFIDERKLLWWDEVMALIRAAGPALAPALAPVLGPGSVDGPLADPARRHVVANVAVDKLKYMSAAEREKVIAAMRAAAGPNAVTEVAAYKMLDWDLVREMRASGVDFQNHGAAHLYLDEATPEQLRADMEKSSRRIEEELGYRPRFFAYPDGRRSALVEEELKRMGYLGAVTTVRGGNRSGCDPYALRRIEASQDFRAPDGSISFPMLWAEVLGVLDFVFLRRFRSPERFSAYRPRVDLV